MSRGASNFHWAADHRNCQCVVKEKNIVKDWYGEGIGGFMIQSI